VWGGTTDALRPDWPNHEFDQGGSGASPVGVATTPTSPMPTPAILAGWNTIDGTVSLSMYTRITATAAGGMSAHKSW
jgi:hypothetical protein